MVQLRTIEAIDRTIHDVGTAWMIHADTVRRSVEFGYRDTLSFYFVGRGGVLGDVDADVVGAAMGYFEPTLTRSMWDSGVAVAGAREGARRYGQACVAWGEDHLSGLPGIDRLVELAERLVATADTAALPLFAGWRAEPPAPQTAGRLLQLIHMLREWRGGLHLAATTAAGLSPLEAILTNDGPDHARFFGWHGDLADCSALKPRHDWAEETTNRLTTTVYERAFSDGERVEFSRLVEMVGGAVLG